MVRGLGRERRRGAARLPPGARVHAHRRDPVHQAEGAGLLIGRLRLYREPNVWADRLRAYRLVVDGHERGAVKEGESLEIELPPGDHRVWMKLDWARSRELTISGEEDANLRCRGNGDPFLALLYITIWRNDYIALERV